MSICVETQKIESPLDTLVLFLSQGIIGGITQIDKLMFLISKSPTLSNLPQYPFEFSNFGPYSVELFDDIQALKIIGGLAVTYSMKPVNRLDTVDEETIESELAESKWNEYPLEKYQLAPEVQKVADAYRHSLTNKQMIELRRIFNLSRLPNGVLFHYVYSTYLPALKIDDDTAEKPKRKWWHFFLRIKNGEQK